MNQENKNEEKSSVNKSNIKDFNNAFFDLLSQNNTKLPKDYDLERNKKLWVIDNRMSEMVDSEDEKFYKVLYKEFMIQKKLDYTIPFNCVKMTGERLKNPCHANFSVKQLFKYLDYLISSSPLTEAEQLLFNRILVLIKSYYKSRNDYYIRTKDSFILENTFYPSKDSCSFQILFFNPMDDNEFESIKLYINSKNT